MTIGTRDDPPPQSNDLNGWRAAICNGSLKSFRLESVVAAFQDLGGRDAEVRNGLAKHLSDSVLAILRRHVAFHHANQGNDIILRAHGTIFEALLKPGCADGRSLREAFTPRVLFRLKDALAGEARERRIPEVSGGEKDRTGISADDGGPAHEARDLSYDTVVPARKWTEATVDEVEELEEEVSVKQILERIPDDRKRLAFYLFMNDVPYKSKRKGVTSIARALGISDKTARDWIKEVRETLTEDEKVRQMKKLRAGDRI